jgi:hypothetical protein
MNLSKFSIALTNHWFYIQDKKQQIYNKNMLTKKKAHTHF